VHLFSLRKSKEDQAGYRDRNFRISGNGVKFISGLPAAIMARSGRAGKCWREIHFHAELRCWTGFCDKMRTLERLKAVHIVVGKDEGIRVHRKLARLDSKARTLIDFLNWIQKPLSDAKLNTYFIGFRAFTTLE
jgi:hypothetical protein